MKKVLILSQDKTRGYLLSTQITKKYGFPTELFEDAVSLIRQQRGPGYSATVIVGLRPLDISPENRQKLSDIAPLLLEDEHGRFQDELHQFFISLGLIKKSPQEEENGYRGIRLYEFMAFNISPCDLFILLGEDRYVKILCKNELYTKEIIENYRKKEIEYLYIREEDLKTYVSDLFQAIRDQRKVASTTAGILNVDIASLDFIHTSLSELGLDELALNMAKATIESVVDSVAQIPELHKKIKQLVSYNSYLAQHSLATAALSCCLANHMGFGHPTTLKKLVVASLFHDIALVDEELSLIVNIESVEYKELSPETKKEFENHVYKAISFVQKIPNLPNNIESIMLEHHERPNGRGFPRGLDSFNISQLSAIFIVAEEFIHHYFQISEGAGSKDKILASMSLEYSKGQYKHPMRELLKLFL